MLPENASLHFQNFYVTRLREAVDNTQTSIYVDVPPIISSGILVLESGVASKREIIYFNSVSGYELQGCVRGLEGTTANTHSQGATVECSVTAGQLDQVLDATMQQGMGDDQNAPMSQWAIKNKLNAIRQNDTNSTPVTFVVSSSQPAPVADKIIVWFEPL